VFLRRCAAVLAATLIAFLTTPIEPTHAAPAADDTAVTHHTVMVGGKTIAYTARAGTLPLKNVDGDEIARVFSVAYTADGADPRTRPVTFVWNGGPGTSSMWLHLGSYGPMRLAVPSNPTAPAPNTPLVPNSDSLIDTTDLVFVDAVGTGYSQITGKGTPATFYGVDEDAKAFDSFVRTWASANQRWGSPKFLMGESYGTTRAANVVNRLQQDGMAVSGVVLISSVLDYNALDNGQGPGEDYGYISFLPTEAAVAWYHHAVAGNPPDLARFVDDVRAFAIGPYAEALMRGDALEPASRRAIVAKLHDYTGLDEQYIERADLRIDPSRFEQTLLRRSGTTTGRLDGRYQGPALDRTADSPTYDPTSDDALTDAFIGAFNRYVTNDLAYSAGRPYLGTNYGVVGGQWKYRQDGSILAPNVGDNLRQALTKNPYLRVFSANGYYDLATPFFGTEYTLHHLALDPALRPHVEFGFYPSGHMIYLNENARRAMKADLVRFYREASGH
jgi:carboxypeptidase C (cathepsin A)